MRRLPIFKLNSTSQTVALASLLSFGTQVVFALLMLRWFTPQEVGEFSVISQIAFFWMTLALAQAPLSLLANHAHDAHLAARHHWRSSVWRWCLLAPLALLALWLSQISVLPALLWVVLIALCQLSWGLAQSFVLRTGNTQQQLSVRVLPPVCSVLVAWLGSQLTQQTPWQGPTLLLAALLGYFVGSLWLAPAWLKSAGNVLNEDEQSTFCSSSMHPSSVPASNEIHPSDNRPSFLRLVHTFFDVLLATAVIIVWQRLYGAQDTGWLSALLRVFGFVPAVIHMAWAQVKLSQPHPDNQHTIWVGLLGCFSLATIGLAGLFALHMQWLDAQWQGMTQYIWPLVLWQSSACLSATYSHHPFQAGVSKKYSLACIGIAGLQLAVLFAPAVFAFEVSPHSHLISFAAVSSTSLLALAKWMQGLR
jgi:O-antigen/teichoic acid export membrane protein